MADAPIVPEPRPRIPFLEVDAGGRLRNFITRPWLGWFVDTYSVLSRVHLCVGDPNSNITADPGHIALDQNGGTGATLWVKESYTNATGWVAK